MKLTALCGAAGAGKDTVADMLPARKLAFADMLYAEVAAAWGVTVRWLKRREFKQVVQDVLRLTCCRDEDFLDFVAMRGDLCLTCQRSPRQILQWWGDYRRAQSPDYFVARLGAVLNWIDPHLDAVITDVRFPNEAAMIRQLGGQIWQIRRPGYEAGGTGHASDTDGSEFSPDLVVTNSGSLEDLRATVLAAWEGSI
ncbi:MAG: hypothetical protein RR326_02930 [Stenotrophomonas sp.]